MSILTIAWSMCGAASFMLGLLHLLLWFKDRRSYIYLVSALMAFSAGAGAMTELALMHAQSLAAYGALLRWENLFVFTLLVPMVWFVRARLPTARRWLAVLITALWSVAILANWLSPYSLVYSEITVLEKMPTFWGEQFTLAVGQPNPWAHLANLASVLIVIYVVDAAARVWRGGDRRRAVLVGGSVATFILFGGVHAPLVDAGLIETPYMIGFAFLAIVLALSYELVSEAVLASRYAKEVRASEARWRSLLTEVQLAVIGIDPDGRVNYANPFLERLIGHRSHVLIGKPMTALVPASDRAELAGRLLAASESGPRPRSRWELLCSSGALRSVVWSTVRLNDGDGHYAGLLSIGEDITARLATERKLEHTHRELERLGRVNVLGELVSVLAHEINQPLAAILSNAQAARRLLASGTLGTDELCEILDDIVSDDKRAGEVIQHLRVMLRKGEVAPERFQLQEPVREVIGLMRGEIDTRGISIQEELDPDMPPVRAGRVETLQVIMNLLVNAVRALSKVPRGRRKICIRAERQGQEAALVTVEDSGPGIGTGELSRVFEPFFTTKSGGLGMGLAICRRIVEAWGGRIWGENGSDGARFCFTLPLAEREGSHD